MKMTNQQETVADYLFMDEDNAKNYATICDAVMSMTKDELDYYEEKAKERKE